MGAVKIFGKTVEALQLLRQPRSPIPKDARTLLVLIDGKRHVRELQGVATANGVEAFDEALAYLEREGLVHVLPERDEEAIEIDLDGPAVADTNRITLDFALPPGGLDARRVAAPSSPAATQAPASLADATVRQVDHARAKLLDELRPKVEEELRRKLLPELRERIRGEIQAKLEAALRPHIERQLRAQIQAELKPKIEREFQARLAAALARRLPEPGAGETVADGAQEHVEGEPEPEPEALVLELERDPPTLAA